ncbi:DUF1835 domain-containing protein [Sporosarcina sp. SAFN-015]|uniref:DUF1835 domain-containing protein n=1 Tax=Sporosarcina sp. SAFN-015 TaxID=3387274 RepID=UPI003F82132A
MVYQIKTQKYVTVLDVNENGDWQTFEVEHEDAFEAFNHETGNLLEGQGFVMDQNDLNQIVDIINESIQKHRQSYSRSPIDEFEVMPVHIVSSESAAGSLQVGLDRPKIVIGFPDSFSIGPLYNLHEKAGQTFRNEWIYEHINYEQDDYIYENKFSSTVREIDDIPSQYPIYIWYGDNVDEQIALRFLLFLLRDKANDIFLLNSTELYAKYITSQGENRKISYTSQIESNDLRILFVKGKKDAPLSEQLRSQLLEEWLFLAQTKEDLRIWEKDEIKGVNEDYFDSLIIDTLEMLHRKQEKKDFIMAGMVIGEVLAETKELINVFFLEYRIRNLLYSGFLEFKGIPKSMRHYSVKLRY